MHFSLLTLQGLHYNIYLLKINFYPSAGTVSDPVWRVLSAVSISQFRLSFSLIPVRHHQPYTRISRKIFPLPAWCFFAMDPQITSVCVCRCNWTG